MSRKYKFLNEHGIYFVSFATVYWIDVFVREVYFSEIINSLNYCIKNKGMKIFAWCIHHNPVAAGFVLEPQHWKYSSAIDYFGGKGLVELDPFEVYSNHLGFREIDEVIFSFV